MRSLLVCVPLVLSVAACNNDGIRNLGPPQGFGDTGLVQNISYIQVGPNICELVEDEVNAFCGEGNNELPVVGDRSVTCDGLYFRAVVRLHGEATNNLKINDTRAYTLVERPTALQPGQGSVEIWNGVRDNPDTFTSTSGQASVRRLLLPDRELLEMSFVGELVDFLTAEIPGDPFEGRIFCRRPNSALE